MCETVHIPLASKATIIERVCNNLDLLIAYHGTTLSKTTVVCMTGFKGRQLNDEEDKFLEEIFGEKCPVVWLVATERKQHC